VKNITLKLAISSADRTLTSEEVSKVMTKIVADVNKQLGAKVV